MAIETDGKTTAKSDLRSIMSRAQVVLRGALDLAGRAARLYGQWYDRISASVGPVLAPVADAVRRSWLMRFIGKTLLRRIVASNLIGFVILLICLTYLIQFSNKWLIDPSIEQLRAQSHVIAAAIASEATKPPEPSGDPLRDDPFAELEFSIKQSKVTPLLPRLLEKTTDRGRVYDVKGNLIADSSRVPTRGSIIPIRRDGEIEAPPPKTKNIWTRLTQWLMNSDLRVYKEIGGANGKFYPEVRAALEGETKSLMLLARRQKIVSVATPIVRNNQVRGVLLMSTAPGAIDDIQEKQLFEVLLLVIAIAVGPALLASYLLTRTVAEPVRQLSQYANEVTDDIQTAKELPRFDERADEVGQLARSFSLMTRALYRRIESSEKFAADVAHELKNPLTAARSTAESLIYVKTDQQRDEFIEQIQLELKRLNSLISDVAAASRLDADLALQKFKRVQLQAIVRSVVDMFRDLASGDGKKVKFIVEPASSGEPYLIFGQDGRIEQVLTNLLANALSFTPEGGEVTVILRRSDQKVELVVEDQGIGIPQENIEKIFSRFYTYRPTAISSRGNNSGLGLAITQEIVNAHDGQIWAENIWPAGGGPAGKEAAAAKSDDVADDAPKPLGARFIVRLPAANGASQGKFSRLRGGR